jgi:hypothetical protein
MVVVLDAPTDVPIAELRTLALDALGQHPSEFSDADPDVYRIQRTRVSAADGRRAFDPSDPSSDDFRFLANLRPDVVVDAPGADRPAWCTPDVLLVTRALRD